MSNEPNANIVKFVTRSVLHWRSPLGHVMVAAANAAPPSELVVIDVAKEVLPSPLRVLPQHVRVSSSPNKSNMTLKQDRT